MGEGAWVFFLEAGLALGLLLFIVWWTMLSTPDRAKRPLRAPPKEDTPSDSAGNASNTNSAPPAQEKKE